ncbi:transporter substrate-binding domain-containing protein [Aquimarina sp. MMG016]|uniref:hybrid sensor histidine kinase/response regulator n=1 Tax=Aquimarina sp. MMG016 TaxID=2822690 RepID=UPI001B3A629D|nr:transporter substrate-binding domain-containing protein [Aquimarina sp. MMG016]MBQ4822758.1 transporter substrate-binding domain-containing protein [Aquimarina sp. MMG016]
MSIRTVFFFLLSIILLTPLIISCKKDSVLKDSELEWLKKNHTITIAIFPYYPPYQFIDNYKSIEGVYIEYIDLIEKKIGHKFKKRYYADWPELMEDVRAHKIDIVMQIQSTPDRNSYLNFYAELFESQHVIAIRKDETYHSINDLSTKNIAVPEDYAIFENLKRKYPNFNFIEDKNDLTCLQKLNSGQYDAYIGPKAVVNYLIRTKNLSNLKIASETKLSYKPGIAVDKNNKTLNNIILKAVNGISESEKQKILDNWLFVKTKPFYRKTNFWIYFIIPILSVLFIVLSVTFYLRHKVEHRTKELRLAKELAEKDHKLKSAFINNVSYEIRTPMNGIMGFSSLLNDTEITKKERKKYTDLIVNSCRQLIKSVDNILEISKLRTGQVELHPEKTDLHEVMNTVFSIFEIKAKEKDISLILNNNIKKDQRFILIDQAKLIKVINSLVENALKYTEKGAILISCTAQNTLIISVRDSGKGIKFRDQKTIFKSLSQSTKQISEKYGGLGLGLTIAKENTQLMGGEISFSSIPNKGTTFRISLPYYPTDSNISESEESETILNPEARHYEILIAEDGEVNFLFLKTILLKMPEYDFNIHRAKNGMEAVDFCTNTNKIDLVFMDIKMPEMNGYDATKRIKVINGQLPVIAQTAYSTKEDIQNAFAAGCDDFISKPVEPKILKKILRKHLLISNGANY